VRGDSRFAKTGMLRPIKLVFAFSFLSQLGVWRSVLELVLVLLVIGGVTRGERDETGRTGMLWSFHSKV